VSVGVSSLPISTPRLPILERVAPAHGLRARWWRRPLDRTTVVTAIAVIFLNLIDAFATLHHIDAGAREMNPLMNALVQEGPLAFFWGKHALAAAGVMGIAAQSHHAVARRMLGFVLLPIYVAIATYQLALFAFI
jgi:hypothetical protein